MCVDLPAGEGHRNNVDGVIMNTAHAEESESAANRDRVNWARVALITLLFAIGAGVGLLVVGNPDPVQITFLSWQADVPLWALLAGVAGVSVVVGAGWGAGKARKDCN